MVRPVTLALLLVALPVLGQAVGGAFGGFSSTGKYLAGKDQVCSPLVAATDGKVSGTPACTRLGMRVKEKFTMPARARATADGRPLRQAIEDMATTVRITALGSDGKPVTLARVPRAEAITALGACYLSADGSLLAIEMTLRGGKADVVVVDISAPLKQGAVAKVPPTGKPTSAPISAPTSAPKSAPISAPTTVAKKETAYDRAMKHGGVWEQRIVACDTAGVTLKLKKDMTFDIRIETRCQGDKDVTDLDGKWVPEGDGDVVLTFANSGADDEAMACWMEGCPDAPGEECLSCKQEDVEFTLQVVKR
jgi:hypothetical protein